MLAVAPAAPAAAVGLRVCYALAAAACLVVDSIPAVRCRFVAYGKTSRTPGAPQSPPERVLDALSAVTVPHSWFGHFYVFSVLSSLFWGAQLATHGSVYRYLADSRMSSYWAGVSPGTANGGGMRIEQVVLVWMAMLLQGIRRSYECLFVQRPSKSAMSVLHYLLGMAFYCSTGIGVWIEGTDAIDSFDYTPGTLRALINAPSAKTMIAVLLFIMASGVQRDCHVYLADLKKYSLPEHPAFQRLICPHYTAECAIYLALTLLAAPQGRLVNWTMGSGLLFVVVNLGVSSKLNREWYRQKFGEDAIKWRRNMIPGVF